MEFDTKAATRIEKGLIASGEVSKAVTHPAQDIRPCIAQLMEMALKKGDFPNRNEAALIIATEMDRIGKNYDEGYLRVEQWNKYHQPPLRLNELRKAVNNGYLGKYNYSCGHAVLKSLCIGEECPWINRVRSKQKDVNDMAFFDYHWSHYLTSRQVLLYSGILPHFERKRRVGKGGLIFVSHRELAEALGKDRSRIGQDLVALAAVGLIEYTPGTPRVWENKASEIRRCFPVPAPTHSRREALKKKTSSIPLDTDSCGGNSDNGVGAK